MLFTINNRFDGSVIFSLECGSFRLCVEAAVKSRADLSRANLSRANLSGADLSGADLFGADLFGANLFGANLSGANLSGAKLSRTELSRADLSLANLSRTDLSLADLSLANLSRTELSRANLSRANLSDANLFGAELSGANLSGAKLSGANLSEAKGAALTLARQRITPSEGAFVAWKKLSGDVIAKLVIPHDAERMNAIGSRKCRASKAFVHEMFGVDEAFDRHTGKTLYKVGHEVIPDKFNSDIREECSHGIHFFMTREEAEDY